MYEGIPLALVQTMYYTQEQKKNKIANEEKCKNPEFNLFGGAQEKFIMNNDRDVNVLKRY